MFQRVLRQRKMSITKFFTSSTKRKAEDIEKAEEVVAVSICENQKFSGVEAVDSFVSSLDATWKELLNTEFKKPYFSRLVNFVNQERRSQTIFPPHDLMFSAFNLCPLDMVRVVIIGQDPYHGPKQAHGLAFSVQKGVPLPPSLKNIYKVVEVIISPHLRMICFHKFISRKI